jgi:hypothetical protein
MPRERRGKDTSDARANAMVGIARSGGRSAPAAFLGREALPPHPIATRSHDQRNVLTITAIEITIAAIDTTMIVASTRAIAASSSAGGLSDLASLPALRLALWPGARHPASSRMTCVSGESVNRNIRLGMAPRSS